MTKLFNTLSSQLNGNNPVIIEGGRVKWMFGHWALTLCITCAWPQLKDANCSLTDTVHTFTDAIPNHTFVDAHTHKKQNPSHRFVTQSESLSELISAGGRPSIHLDLSIATILITPECCQAAKLGGEYWFNPSNWLIAMYNGAVFYWIPSLILPFTSFCHSMYCVNRVRCSPEDRVFLWSACKEVPPYFSLAKVAY